jgi:hypothetical protein
MACTWRVALATLGALTAAPVTLAHCVGDAPAFPSPADGGDELGTSSGGSDAPATPVDAGSGSEPSAEAGPPCDLSKPFGSIENVRELNVANDDESARLTPDELTVYFSRRNGANGAYFIYTATRSTPSAQFGALTQLALLPDPSGPSIAPDRSTLYYSSDVQTDSGLPDLYAASVPFTAGTSADLSAINSSAWDFTPYIRPDNLALYFASNRLGSDDLYVSPRVNGAFVAPTYLGKINTGASERTPVVTADDQTLFFASDGTGNYDVYVSTRAHPTDAFGAPKAVGELDTSAVEMPDWISADGCRIYFRSDRAGGAGGRDIWRAHRP